MRYVIAAAALALAWQAPLAASEPAGPETIMVELSNFKYTPSALTLHRGHAYRLHLVNAAGGGHDFSAPEFFAASTVAPADRATVAGGKIRLTGHQTVDVTLTPQRAGSYKLTCTHFMHSGFGMKGTIVVD